MIIPQQQPVSQIIKSPYSMKLWQLRHLYVQLQLEKYKITRLMDFGCNTGKFIKRLSRSSCYQLLVGVDNDIQLLKNETKNELYPQDYQYNIRYQRKQRLIITLIAGDILKKSKHLKQLNVQALTLIQLIQHIPQSQLYHFNQNIFGYYRPQIVIITTPNRQFNNWFGDQHKIRHFDHKFEWSRYEFEQYCKRIKQEYGYDYKIFGVGQHVQSEEFGYCSQGVTFVRMVQGGKIKYDNFQEIVEIEEYRYVLWQDTIDQDIQMEIRNKYRRMKENYEIQMQNIWSIEQLIEGIYLQKYMNNGIEIKNKLIKKGYIRNLTHDKFQITYNQNSPSSEQQQNIHHQQQPPTNNQSQHHFSCALNYTKNI